MVYTWQTECLYCFLMIGMREGVPPSKCDNLFCSNENGYAVLINACGIDKVYCIDICLCKCAEQVRKIKNWKQLNIAKKLRDFVANANGMTVDIDAKVFFNKAAVEEFRKFVECKESKNIEYLLAGMYSLHNCICEKKIGWIKPP